MVSPCPNHGRTTHDASHVSNNRQPEGKHKNTSHLHHINTSKPQQQKTKDPPPRVTQHKKKKRSLVTRAARARCYLLACLLREGFPCGLVGAQSPRSEVLEKKPEHLQPGRPRTLPLHGASVCVFRCSPVRPSNSGTHSESEK